MVKIKKVVFDAGPFIHLYEIEQLGLISLFENVLTTEEILQECSRIRSSLEKQDHLVLQKLTADSKDFAKYVLERYDLDLGEATGIALCKQEKIKLFFTDDLEARAIAHLLGFEPHGTVAILLRAYREKILTKKEVRLIVEEIHLHSTLFLTSDIKEWILGQIEEYK